MNHCTEALRQLHEYGAHLALMTPDKRPVHRGWLDEPAPLAAVLNHAAAGGLVGIVPGSIGMVAVDVDRGDSAAVVDVLGEPLATVASRRKGGAHLYYRAAAGEVRNGEWTAGESGGEIRGTNGAAVLWDAPAVAAAVAGMNGSAAVDVSKLAKPKPVRAVRDAPMGARNNTLFREARALLRREALATGLTPQEIDRTLDSAERSVLAEFEYTPRRRGALDEAVHRLEMTTRIEAGGVRLYSPGLRELFPGGLLPGEFVIFASRPGGAKTTLLICEAVELLRNGVAVLFVSLDTSPTVVYARIVAAHHGQRWADYFDASTLPVPEREQAYLDFAKSSGDRFALLDGRWTLAQLRAEITDWLAVVGERAIVVVDTSNRVAATGDAYQRHSDVAEGLADMAHGLNVAIIALTHVNRASGGAPGLEHLSNSGAVEQVADRVVMLVPQDAKEAKPAAWCPKVRMKLAKDRYPIGRPEGRWEWNVTVEPQFPRVASGW